MQPQGIAPEGPIAHLIVADGGRPISGISIQRLHGHRRFDDEDLAMCNLLAPHLARAHAVRRQLRASRQEQGVRTEVLDRIPTGIVLVDSTRLVVAINRAGERILRQRDGIQLDDGLLHATGRSNQIAMDALLDSPVAKSPEPAGGFMAIQRPSGRRPYSVNISPLLDRPAESQVGGRASAVFITDPEPNAARLTASIHAFEQMYNLTPAEARLISLLAEGRSLQEISDERGVTINTTRTQLGRLFRKTQTSRQSELVQLALTGIAGVSQD
jgi:DNA-binding CsgD family transcriptional regulator